MKVHHIGYAVKSIESAKEKFLELGYMEEGETIQDTIRNVSILFLTNGSNRVELVAPLQGNTPIDMVLKKNGPYPYHICYIAEHYEQEIAKLSSGWMLIEPLKEAPALNGKRVAFWFHKDIGLLEIMEEKA